MMNYVERSHNRKYLNEIGLTLALLLVIGLIHTSTAQAAKVVTKVTVNAQVGTLAYGTSGAATFPVTVNTSAGQSGTIVTPTVTGLPAGVAGSFVPTSIDVAKGTRIYNATLTISTSGSTPAGTSNFTVTVDGISNTGTLAIGQRTLTVSATGVNKTYDGTTAATVILADNRVPGDVLTASCTGATFSDPNVGSAKQVSVTGISVSGPAVGNYTAANTTATTTASITKATASVTLGSLSQVWDGSPKSATATTVPAGLNVSVTYDGYPSAPTLPGSYTVAGTVNDTNYQGSATGTLTISDTTGPVLNLSTLSDGAVTNRLVLNISGKATDVSAIDSILINGTRVNQSEGYFNTAIFLKEGVNAITVTAIDASATHNQTTVTRSITLDFAAPALTVTAPSDGSTTVGSQIDITGAIDPGCTVDVVVNGGSPQAATVSEGGLAYTAIVSLVAGMNTIEVNATSSGKTNSIKRTVLSDAQGVTLQLGTVEDSHVIERPNTIAGTIANFSGGGNVLVEADGQSYAPSVSSGGAFGQAVILSDTLGVHTAVVTATDAGHTSSVQRNYIMFSNVKLSANLPTPRAPGTHVTFTADAPSGSGPFEYQFQVSTISANNFKVVRNYSSSNAWEWDTTGIAPDAYYVVVYVRDAVTKACVARSYRLPYYLLVSAPATAATLTASSASPQGQGTTVTFTAGATDPNPGSPLEYQFKVKAGTVTTVVRDWSSANTWDMTGYAPGVYTVYVYVRNQGSIAAYEAYKGISYTVLAQAPATNATLTASLASPQVQGTTVTFTAGATDPNPGTPLQYQFKVTSGTTTTVVQDWSRANTWGMTGYAAGVYTVYVYVRNQGSIAAYEAYKGISYTLLAEAPATNATLTASLASPQVQGTTVTFTAGATTSTGPLEYQFKVKAGTVTTVVRDWSSANTWQMATGGTGYAPGIYTVYVYVRNQGSLMTYETTKALGYTVVAAAPAINATLTANLASPQTLGTTVMFTAGATTSTGPLEYQFKVKSGTTTAIVQDWSANNTWGMVTGGTGYAPGIYTVYVYVRNQGSLMTYETTKALGYTVVAAAPATNATLTANLANPQTLGTTVMFAAGATTSTGPLEYQFKVKSGTTTAIVQDWSANNTWEWHTAGYSAGIYTVYVYVRNQGSLMTYETTKALGYTVVAAAPATNATLTANLASPQAQGTTVMFTAGATTTTGPLEYQFKVKSGTTTAIVQDWSANNTWGMITGGTGYAPGIYTVYVYVRNQGSIMASETYNGLGYTIR